MGGAGSLNLGAMGSARQSDPASIGVEAQRFLGAEWSPLGFYLACNERKLDDPSSCHLYRSCSGVCQRPCFRRYRQPQRQRRSVPDPGAR
ncbi:hypothetical protein EMIT043CA1_200038 [Pseudomonas brassicacearum]